MNDPSQNPYASPQTDSREPVAEPLLDRPLLADESFWGLTATQFLGAFNDNLYKQLLLLLFVSVPQPGGGTRDLQQIGLLMFSLPFILFSGFAGFLSDRLSKRPVIVICKWAEIGIMLLGLLGFLWMGQAGLHTGVLIALSAVLFFMGTHSAFFGPSKYGILPELFRQRDLPTANGIVLATTFLAIIFGSGLAGVLKKHWGEQLWMAGGVCACIAGVGLATSLLIRRLPASSPGLQFESGMLAIPRDIRNLLRNDRSLRNALIASTSFWLAAALVQPALNALGERQLKCDPAQTSLLVTVVSVGIATGSILAGALAQGRRSLWVQRSGAWGMTAMLVLMSIRGGPQLHWLGYRGSLIVLIGLGVFTGMFAVPLQVYLQSKPPEGQKGRMIATQNLLNWLGIFVSAGIYGAAVWVLEKLHWTPNGVFAITAAIMLPVAVCFRPVVPESAAA